MNDMHVTVIDADGRPLHEYMGPAEHLAVNVPKGCLWVVGAQMGDWWSDGQWNCRPEPVSPHAKWCWALLQWQLDETEAQQHAWQEVRSERNQRLQATDWRVVRAAEQGLELHPQWQSYRQALRDVTSQPDPQNIHWPEIPKEDY